MFNLRKSTDFKSHMMLAWIDEDFSSRFAKGNEKLLHECVEGSSKSV